jgi:predicted Zn-ribbon and HTH transcriptional regulator
MKMLQFRSGNNPTTQIGYINERNQKCHGTLDVSGNDHLQYSYRLECLNCGYIYGVNGTDIKQRKCPECQGGEPGIKYWTK